MSRRDWGFLGCSALAAVNVAFYAAHDTAWFAGSAVFCVLLALDLVGDDR